MDSPVQVVGTEIIGQALLPDGGRAVVKTLKHNQPWPGSGTDVLYAVDEYRAGGSIVSTGFFYEEDCYRFLTGWGEVAFDIYDQFGRPQQQIRYGLRVPDGAISRRRVDVATGVTARSVDYPPEVAAWMRANQAVSPGPAQPVDVGPVGYPPIDDDGESDPES